MGGNRSGATRAHKHNSSGPLKEVNTTNATGSLPAKNKDQSWFDSLREKWSVLPTWKYAICAVPFLIGCGMFYKRSFDNEISEHIIDARPDQIGEDNSDTTDQHVE